MEYKRDSWKNTKSFPQAWNKIFWKKDVFVFGKNNLALPSNNQMYYDVHGIDYTLWHNLK